MRMAGGWLVVCWMAVGVAQAAAQGQAGGAAGRRQDLHGRGLQAVEAERARAKQPLCPTAVNTVEINGCYAAEVQVTAANYLKLVRALGALLRVDGEEVRAPAGSVPSRIPFDDAEAAWNTYRE